MAPKIPKRSTQKKSPINIPKDAKVKIIEITPRTFIIPLLIFALIWALVTLWDQNSSTKSDSTKSARTTNLVPTKKSLSLVMR